MPDRRRVTLPVQHQAPEQIHGLRRADHLGHADLFRHLTVPDQRVMEPLLAKARAHEAQHVPQPALRGAGAPLGRPRGQQQVQQSGLQVVVGEAARPRERCLLSVQEGDDLEAVQMTGIRQEEFGEVLQQTKYCFIVNKLDSLVCKPSYPPRL